MIKKVFFYKNMFFDIWIKDFNVMINVFDLKILCYNCKGSKDIDKERKFLNLLFVLVYVNEKFNRSYFDYIFLYVLWKELLILILIWMLVYYWFLMEIYKNFFK